MDRIGLLLLTLCFTVVSLFATPASADAPGPDGIKVSSVVKENKVLLKFEGHSTEKVQVTLYDSTGTLIDIKSLTETHSSVEFDKLEKGDYWLSIKKQERISLERVTID